MTDLAGASPETVRTALECGDPLPGTRGFAGALDGTLVRDVLGRVPLFHDGEAWSHRPTDLDAPERLPAGHVRRPDHTVERVWRCPASDPRPEGTVERVRDAVGAAVTAVDGEGEDLAVGFSGGVDSGLVAAGVDAPLYAVGFTDGRDLANARAGAAAMDRELRTVELDLETLESAVPVVARATGRTNAMDVAIALPLYLLAERVAADGLDRLALGQGADELFGGYAKVAGAPGDDRVAADTVRGARDEVLADLPSGMERDWLVCTAADVTPVFPLLDDRLVRTALALPGPALVDGDRRKVALRSVASEQLPTVVAEREKVALQYGTQASRELDRLARRAGFKRREDDHVRRYVESRLE